MWLAGGGIKPGVTLGETDDFGFNVTQGPRPRPRPARHDPAPAWASTTTRFTYKFQGLDQRLTGVEPARVVKEILA